jgi:hypothetical protein
MREVKKRRDEREEEEREKLWNVLRITRNLGTPVSFPHAVHLEMIVIETELELETYPYIVTSL